LPLLIHTETPADQESIREVNRLAFGRDDEASLIDALRNGGYVRISLVAEVDRLIVGHVLFSELPILGGTEAFPALALAPMAVLPEYQRQGIGSQLLRCGLETCREHGHRIIVVLGHPNFYRRFGFSSELARQLDSPFSGMASFMAMELVEGALNGVSGKVQYPPPFGVV
jgi:putative acetyltransferase